MSVDLPPQLKAAVLHERAAGGLAGKARSLSAHYRAGGASNHGIDLGAYLAARLPATYAAVARVLAELKSRRPDFAPAALLDAGSGPGTASWAAVEFWPALAAMTFLDNNRGFLDLAKRLAAASTHAGLAGARAIAGDLERPVTAAPADLVIAAYALAELPEARAGTAAAALWQASSEALVIIEPGTPQGYGRILAARAALVAAGAHLVAPCPHAGPCPLASPDWCHFSVRLPRSREHLHAKAARVPFEDEKFAYLIAARTPASPAAARILAPPRRNKAGIALKLCTPAGLEGRTIASRDRDAYKRARKLDWGDTVS